MANSLGFLDKPANNSSTVYGPQPKPATPTTTAPKTFLDASNPWMVGGGTPTTSSSKPKASTSKAKTTASAPLPTSGYNYTESSTASGQPAYVRRQEVDNATMSGQAAGQRRSQLDAQREAAARAAAQPPPVPVVVANPGMAAQGLGSPLAAGIVPAVQSMAQRAMQRYAEAMAGAPAQQPASPLATPAAGPPNNWQMAPTAEQAMAARSAGQPQPTIGTPAISPQAGTSTGPWMTPAQLAAAGQQSAQQPTTAATTNTQAWRAAQGRGDDGEMYSYGWKVPGPIMVERQVDLQRGQNQPWQLRYNPAWTNIGLRFRMSDEVLAAETANRQRQAGQPVRPWNSYSDAEKYQLRYGVAPVGAQISRPTSGEAAITAANTQHERLVDRWWQQPQNQYMRRWPEWSSSGPLLPAPPVQAQRTTAPAAAQAGTDFMDNDVLLANINPQGVEKGEVTQGDVTAVAAQILRRYRPEINPAGLSFEDILGMLALGGYSPPEAMKAQFAADLTWLKQFIQQ